MLPRPHRAGHQARSKPDIEISLIARRSLLGTRDILLSGFHNGPQTSNGIYGIIARKFPMVFMAGGFLDLCTSCLAFLIFHMLVKSPLVRTDFYPITVCLNSHNTLFPTFLSYNYRELLSMLGLANSNPNPNRIQGKYTNSASQGQLY